MSSAPTHSGLFPDLDLSASPCLRVEGRRCGRGAVPQIVRTIEIEQPNPTGYRKLTFRFRPLKRHSTPYRGPVDTDPNRDHKEAASDTSRDRQGAVCDTKLTWQVACNLILHYFRLVGGFRTATDAVVTTWSEALAHFTPEQIAGAIQAKADSLRPSAAETARAKRLYVPRADRFAAPEILEGWIAKSMSAPVPEPEGERLLREARSRRRLSEIRPAAAKSGTSVGSASAPAPHSRVPGAARTINPVDVILARAAGAAPHNRELWNRLADVQRRTIERAGYPVFDEQVRDIAGASANPHDPRFDDWQLDLFVELALKRWAAQMLG